MLKSRLTQNAVSKLKTIFRFEQQDVNWSIDDLHHYSDAFARGLRQSQIGRDNKVLFWVDENHTTEFVTSVYGTFKAGAQALALNKLLSEGDRANPRIVREVIEHHNPSAVVVSPNQKIGASTKGEVLLNAIPEALSSGTTGYIKVPTASNLKFLIQTAFFARPGFIKFRDFLVYRTKNYSKFPLFDTLAGVEELETRTGPLLQGVRPEDQVFVVSGLDNHDLVIRAILEANANGNVVVFVSDGVVSKSDFLFASDVDPNVKLHFVGSPEQIDAVKAKISHANVNLISA